MGVSGSGAMDNIENFKDRADRLMKLAEQARERYLVASETSLAEQAELLIDTVKVICEAVEAAGCCRLRE